MNSTILNRATGFSTLSGSDRAREARDASNHQHAKPEGKGRQDDEEEDDEILDDPFQYEFESFGLPLY